MISLAVYGAAVFALASVVPAAQAGRHSPSNSTSTHGESDVAECSQIDVEFGSREAFRAEEHFAIPAAETTSLDLSSSPNGGIWVKGWDRPDFAVTACKAAADESGVLDEIRISRHGNRLAAQGPDGEDWLVHWIVSAPKGSSLSLDTANGPISLRNFAGLARIDSENGPVSLKACSGALDVSTQNGPIRLTRGSGNVNLVTQNGPLSVELTGGTWKDGKLSGETQNGPIGVKFAAGSQARLSVTMSEHSPVRCRADACHDARRDWDDSHRTIEFGGSPLVTLSTVNGPVSIDSID
jgi:hypothetical protein